MRKLFLVRHAEPAITGVLLGRSDPPLSEAGRRAAGRLQLPAATVYSSPLLRALETAEALGAQVQVLEELAEISYGEWDGKSWPEIERLHPPLAAAKQRDWASVTPPGGEAWVAFAARVEGAWELIRRGPFPAAIVAHAAVNAELARLIAGGDPFQFEQSYCGVLEYEI